MAQIRKLLENTIHDQNFFVDRPNGYPFYLLILVKTPARFFVEGEWIETPPNIAVVFHGGQPHLYGALLKLPDSLSFHSAYIDDWIHLESKELLLPEHFPYGKPIILHNPENYYSLFHLIALEYFGNSPHRHTILDALTTALLEKLLDASNTKKSSPFYYELVKLREKIYATPQQNWTVKNMADTLHISSGYLHTQYKNIFHTTCMKDVIHSRISNACELLSATQHSIEEIALSCGYHNTEHFIRQFKKEVGTTPSHYRNDRN